VTDTTPESAVRAALDELFDLPPVDGDAFRTLRLREDLHADGLDVAELMMLVEEGIDILLPRGSLPETVGELLDVANYFSHPDENGVSG